MNWSAVTAIVDTVGLAVIVISLLYISRQTKQAKDHAAAASEIDYMDGVSQIFNEWASDEHTADIIRKGFAAFDELSKAEQALFDGRVGAIFNHMLLGKQLSASGLLSETVADEVEKIVISVLCTDGGYRYFELAQNAFPGGPELFAEVGLVRDKHPRITDIMPWWREA